MKRLFVIVWGLLPLLVSDASALSVYETFKMESEPVMFYDWDSQNCKYRKRCFPLDLAINRDKTRLSYTYRLQRFKNKCSTARSKSGMILPHIMGTVTAHIRINENGKLRVREVVDNGGGGRHVKIAMNRKNGAIVNANLPVPRPRTLYESLSLPPDPIPYYDRDDNGCRYLNQCRPVRLKIKPDRTQLSYTYKTRKQRQSCKTAGGGPARSDFQGMVTAVIRVDGDGVLHILGVKDIDGGGAPIRDYIRFKNGLVVE